ncbi:hypothetical protein TRVL_04134 [Trypanosoma vivax]|nr:hypothetical protein TRVL_04134 [Trypanosoma vivax]
MRTGRKNCIKGCSRVESERIALHLDCNCWGAEGAQKAGQRGEVQGTGRGAGASSASDGNAERRAQYVKTEKSASAAARNSQEVAFLYPLLPFIAVMPKIN